jgi:glycosyltransferase involved in cell wall biosynthesis
MVVTTLADLGHEVLVVGHAPPPPRDRVRFEELPASGHVEQLVEETERGQVGRERNVARRRVQSVIAQILENSAVEQTLRRVIPRYRPEAVVELYSPFGFAGVFTCAALRVRHLLNVHAPLAWEGRVFRAQPFVEAADLIEERVFAASPRIAVNSREMGEILRDMGVDDAKITVIPNGVDVSLFAPDGPDHRDRLPRDAVVIGFTGSLKPWHGIGLLIDAFGAIALSDQRVHLLVVGDGPMRRAIRDAAQRFPGRVTATGLVPLEEVPGWLRTMDIAVTPYQAMERFYFSPLKTLEYMAAGRATVSAGIGQLRELIDDGRTGLRVPPGDTPALARALARLVNDAALRVRLGAEAAEEAALHHRWSDRIAALVEAAVTGVERPGSWVTPPPHSPKPAEPRGG